MLQSTCQVVLVLQNTRQSGLVLQNTSQAGQVLQSICQAVLVLQSTRKSDLVLQKHHKGGTWKGVKEHQSKLGASAKKHSGAGSGAGATNVHLKSTAPSTSSPSSHCSSWEEPGLGSGLHLCWPSGMA